MNQPQVKEFVIVPPAEIRESILMRAERICEWLSDRFPGRRFRIEARSPLSRDVFQVVPVMSAGAIGDAILMCETPAPTLIVAIREACEHFALDQRQGLNA